MNKEIELGINYVNNIKKSAEIGKGILEYNKNIPNRTVIFDFDETLCDSETFNDKNECKPIIPIVELAKYAKTLNYNVYIITARPSRMRETTIKNAENFGIKIDNVFTIIPSDPYDFKSIMRRNLQLISKERASKITSEDLYNLSQTETRTQNLKIVLTIGDQPQDVKNCYGYYAIKLPYYHTDNIILMFNNMELSKF